MVQDYCLVSGPFKARESSASLIFPSPRSYGEKVAEGRMRGIFRQLNHPSPGLASLAPLRPLPADAGRGEKKDRLSPDPSEWCSSLLPIAYCLLPIAYCLLPIAYCLLPIAYCLLPIAYCLITI